MTDTERQELRGAAGLAHVQYVDDDTWTVWIGNRRLITLPSKGGADEVCDRINATVLSLLDERDALSEQVGRAEFLLALMAATFDGPLGWLETRRLWHSAIQDNYENAYVEQTVADEWRRRAQAAEARAEALTRENEGLREAVGRSCYLLSEPHLSGFRVILGFDTMAAAHGAHEAILRLVTQSRALSPPTADEPAKGEA